MSNIFSKKTKKDVSLWTTQSAERKLEVFASMIDKSILSYPNLIKRSFVSGVFTGLGATVGVILIFTILTTALNWLGGIAFIKEYFHTDQVLNQVQQFNPKNK